MSVEQTNLGDWSLRGLSPAEREVYRAVEEAGRPIQAVAVTTERDPSTVRTLLHRARRKRGEAPRVC